MADMSEWTEDEKVSYLKIMHRLDRHGEPLSDSEVEELSNNVKYALVEFYRDVIAHECPRGRLQIMKDLFKRWSRKLRRGE